MNVRLNKKHQRTLEAIFSTQTPATLQWRRIEALFMALGATKKERKGSGIVFQLNGKKGYISHPSSPKRSATLPNQTYAKFLRRSRNNTMKTMTYKGHTAEIYYSDEDGFFVGDVVGINDIICFHGNTDEELRVAFEGVVDLYIEALEEPENPPQKHFAGKLLSRLRQALHL